MFNPQLIIFDLDGTLVDSAPDIAVALNRSLSQHGVAGASEDAIRDWVGRGPIRLVECALLAAGADVEALRQPVFEGYAHFYGEQLDTHSTLFPGVPEALRTLEDRGYRLAICSNKLFRFITPLLEAYGIAEHFQVLLGGDSLPERKPSPAPLLKLAADFGLAPQDCLMVGDSIHDVHAARAAGMPVVAMSHGYNHGEDIADSRPDALLDTMAELPGLLLPR